MRIVTDRGFALLIVLWSIVLLALLVTHLTATGRQETQLAGNLRDAAVMESAADAAVSEAIFHLLDSSDGHWPANGLIHRVYRPNAVVDLSIGNEAGKLNINTVQPALLRTLLRVNGVDAATADSLTTGILDWRFPDARTLPGGVEAQRYRQAGRDYAPPGAPFQSLQELNLVLGMTPAIETHLTPYLSVYHDGEPDTRFAASPVLQAIKDATGTDPQPTTGPPDERLVVITATARRTDSPDRGGSQFVRRAIVRIGLQAHGGLFRILTWDSPTG